MKPTPSAYRKLPGRGLGWAGFARLWLADDHLLEVNSMLFYERYRRFFLPDVIALVIRRTKVRLFWSLGLGFVGIGGSLLAGGLAYGGKFAGDADERVMLWVFAGMVAPFALVGLVLFFINLLLGPTCRCHLQTAAGWHPLAAPTRLRPARRLFAQLAPLLGTVQAAPTSPPVEAEVPR